MKPYVVCHMLSSIDGRIKTSNWDRTDDAGHYERTGSLENADAWMCGRVTMEEHFALPLPELEPATEAVLREDHVADAAASVFAIAVDKDGKLGWESREIDGDHLVVVLQENVSDAYLVYLREKGISYVFGGADTLDFGVVLEKLNQLFGIKKIKLEGGGGINGAMLAAGLIDEYSFLFYPVADGSNGPTSIDTGKAVGELAVVSLELLDCQVLDKKIVWLRYKVK